MQFRKFARFTRFAPNWVMGAALLAASGLSHAVTFSFTANGFGVTSQCATADCMDGFTIGDANDTGGTIASTWSQLLNFTVTPSTGALSGTWALNDYSASLHNDLSGTFTGTWLQVSPTQSRLTLNYTVTSGAGVFEGFVGTGTSVLLADAEFGYTETGSFNVSAVPEPSTWALWAGGLAAMGGISQRRRRAA